MDGKVSDRELLAYHALDSMKQIARCEGHSRLPDEQEMVGYVGQLPEEEASLKNREQEKPNSRGFIPSRNIAGLFRK